MTRIEIPPSALLPQLLFSTQKTAQEIKNQIDKGEQIVKSLDPSRYLTKKDLSIAKTQLDFWSRSNAQLLRRLFRDSLVCDSYLRDPLVGSYASGDLSSESRALLVEIGDKIGRLRSIIELLELIMASSEYISVPPVGEVQTPTMVKSPVPTAATKPVSPGNDVFIVHGHDEAVKDTVARFIQQLGLSPTILHEKPSEGKTIIEKLEKYSNNARFAVVLLTPDDTGGPRDGSRAQKYRARQNVIFELGYFFGKIGRNNVCALYKEGVELPSDYHGVIYVPMDAAGGWKLTLAREIKQAGIDVDLAKTLT